MSCFHQVLGGADQHLIHGPCCWPGRPHDGVGLWAEQDTSALRWAHVSWWAFQSLQLDWKRELSQLGPKGAPTHNPLKEWAHSLHAVLGRCVQDYTYNHSHHMAMECHLQAQGLKKNQNSALHRSVRRLHCFI